MEENTLRFWISNTLRLSRIQLNLNGLNSYQKLYQFSTSVYTELFDVFLSAAGSAAKYKQDLKCAQLKIAYTILFDVGLRVNEIRFFQEKDIQDAI